MIIGASIQTLVRRVRQRGEEAARGREFLLAVMNSAAEGIVSIDVQGRVMYANPSGCELLGYDPTTYGAPTFTRWSITPTPTGARTRTTSARSTRR